MEENNAASQPIRFASGLYIKNGLLSIVSLFFYKNMKSDENIYLIVLSHGLWGNKNHMGFIEKQINETYQDVHVVRI